MENLVFSANIVAPLLMLMLVGYFVRRQGIVNKQTVSQCNGLIFKVFLPVLVFNNVRASSLENLGSIDIYVFVFVVFTLAFLVGAAATIYLEPEQSRRGAFVQGMIRSNYAILGLPIVSLLFPGQDIAVASILLTVIMPVGNVWSVIVLAFFGSQKVKVKDVLLEIAKNPLIIATFLGMLMLVCPVTIPSLGEELLSDLGSVATPFSLVVLGAGFEFKKLSGMLRSLILAVLGKLVVVPLIGVTLAVLCGFRGVELACVLIHLGAPAAVSTYTMAERMGSDGDLASAIVVFSSVFCILTIFIGIFVVKSLALI